MITERCRREEELLDALARGFVGEELIGHVSACESCAELRKVAGALLEERVQAVAEAPVPAAGAIWLRMQVRYRREVESGARRSLLIGQAATLAIAIALTASFFGADVAVEVREVFATIQLSTPLLLALTAWLLLAPLAGYVAIRQK